MLLDVLEHHCGLPTSKNLTLSSSGGYLRKQQRWAHHNLSHLSTLLTIHVTPPLVHSSPFAKHCTNNPCHLGDP